MFTLSAQAIDVDSLRKGMLRQDCGGFATFEGWVRDLNEGKSVTKLEYEAYPELASLEAERILDEACRRYPIRLVKAVHRVGSLDLTDVAVWIGVAAVHRGEAFDACRFLIDEIKKRVPIWKKEFFADGTTAWTRCEHCADGSPHHHQAHD